MNPTEKPLLAIGAGVAIMDPQGRLFTVQQDRGGTVNWSLVGGGIEQGEGIEQCAVREAFEESGLRVRLVRLLTVDEFWHAGIFRGIGFTFLAVTDPWPQQVRLPETDGATRFLAYRWLTQEEAREVRSDANFEYWVPNWPPDITETRVRRLDFER